MCFVTTDDDDSMNFPPSNVKLLRNNSISKEYQQQHQCSNNAPKKNLPHKKRITKKLKSISPNVDQMQASIDPTAYHHHNDIQRHSSLQEQSYSVVTDHHHHSHHQQQQNETLNLALNSQPIQLTTTQRIDGHHQPGTIESTNQNEFITSEQFNSQMHQISMPESSITTAAHTAQSAIQSVARFSCELCGMQAETQLNFYNHLKLHYEPDVPPAHSQNYKLSESIRNTNLNTSLPQSDQHIFQLANGNDERKLVIETQCIPTAPPPVIMSGNNSHNFVRVSNGEQDDFGCISGVAHGNIGSGVENDVDDDDDDDAYNDTGLVGIKSEQNEFSDTEDMLENGVLDKVQRVVDSYIENGTSDVKNLIDLNENQNHSSLEVVDGTCNWNASGGSENNTVYGLNKHEQVDAMDNFVITNAVANRNKESSNKPRTVVESTAVAQNHIMNDTAVITRPEELTLIYEINVNDKDFPIMDDTSTESKCFEEA